MEYYYLKDFELLLLFFFFFKTKKLNLESYRKKYFLGTNLTINETYNHLINSLWNRLNYGKKKYI